MFPINGDKKKNSNKGEGQVKGFLWRGFTHEERI